VSAASPTETARLHRVTTPEGISLPFAVASVGDRITAFVIDFFVILLVSILATLATGFLMALGAEEAGTSLAILIGFLLWNFYFVFCEVQWGGMTIGKRKVGLRVISRDGGPLTAEAIFARNLMRNLELYLPLGAVVAPTALFPGAPGWGALFAIAWILVFAFMPLFNKDRLRCGDLVAGTLVVRAPKTVLLPDLAERPVLQRPVATGRVAAPAPADEYPFTREQLDIYGIHELQVLEDLLRRDEQGTLDGRVLDDVAEKIKLKIAWPHDRWHVPARPFLQAFYRAQRALLEQKMLFGQRRERKRA
jgi:uncharacterized RDD family membrane protein YckC